MIGTIQLPETQGQQQGENQKGCQTWQPSRPERPYSDLHVSNYITAGFRAGVTDLQTGFAYYTGMTAALIFKSLVFILLILIFISLSGGLFFLARDKGGSKRAVYSLTVRVVLSITLFLLLLTGFLTGLIQPHGILPG